MATDSTQGGPFQRAGDLLTANDLESRPAPCPQCGKDSLEIRYAPKAGLSEAARARLDADRPFFRRLCGGCETLRREDAERKEHVRRCAVAVDALVVPPLYANATLESFELDGAAGDDLAWLERALTFARDYVRDWPEVPAITLFVGGCGTGKGHIFWSLAKHLASTRGVAARVAVLSDVIRDLREAWNTTDGPTEAERIGKYRRPDLLVIDEVSRHALYGQPQQHLYDLVAWREVWLKPVIITSNDAGDELKELLGPAITSRAIGADAVVNFGARDWRRFSADRRRELSRPRTRRLA